ncbi:MAG: hypothetical protein M3450_15460 [Actinomycetota bacterium]|nr:hypothetical protein [Actinomycetota bacterium]
MATPPHCVLLDHVPSWGTTCPSTRARRLGARWSRPPGLEPRPWDPRAIGSLRPTLGVLVCDGLMTRTIALNARTTTELLGPGDILRPWDEEDDGGPVRFSIWGLWRVRRITGLSRDRRPRVELAR